MDTNKIKEIINIFEDSQLSKMDLTDGELHLVLEKEVEPIEKSKGIHNEKIDDIETKQEKGQQIKSPLVGTYYQASGTDQEPYVHVGDYVNEGDTLCIIEAMKVMNEIQSPTSGTVLSIHVKNGETVEYNQVLMEIG